MHPPQRVQANPTVLPRRSTTVCVLRQSLSAPTAVPRCNACGKPLLHVEVTMMIQALVVGPHERRNPSALLGGRMVCILFCDLCLFHAAVAPQCPAAPTEQA
jgi:hypothetical protein